MKKVVVTGDIIRNFRYLHRESDWTPRRPYCKLCSVLMLVRGRVSRRRSTIRYFAPGMEVYRVDYANGHVGYYHTECIDNPKDEWMRRRVENILRYDPDRWTELKAFIDKSREQNRTNSQIAREIQEQFGCSRATAYRKLRLVSSQNP